jgi:hypothetical protein
MYSIKTFSLASTTHRKVYRLWGRRTHLIPYVKRPIRANSQEVVIYGAFALILWPSVSIIMFATKGGSVRKYQTNALDKHYHVAIRFFRAPEKY